MEQLTRKNAKVGLKVVASSKWGWHSQNRMFDSKLDPPAHRDMYAIIESIDKYKNTWTDKNDMVVHVTWEDGSKNCYYFKDFVIKGETKEIFQEVYVSDVSEEDAKIKKVKKIIVQIKEDDDFPYVCVNNKEEALNFRNTESVKTSSWMFAITVV